MHNRRVTWSDQVFECDHSIVRRMALFVHHDFDCNGTPCSCPFGAARASSALAAARASSTRFSTTAFSDRFAVALRLRAASVTYRSERWPLCVASRDLGPGSLPERHIVLHNITHSSNWLIMVKPLSPKSGQPSQSISTPTVQTSAIKRQGPPVPPWCLGAPTTRVAPVVGS